MPQLFPVDKNTCVQKYLKRMQTSFMQQPELYFNPITGELYNSDMPNNMLLISVNPGNYPVYEQDNYLGYVTITDHEVFITVQNAILIWH